MTRLHCPQCQSQDTEYYEGLLGYEAVRCNACNIETDLNNPQSYCERTDRTPVPETTLPDLCHHAEYRIYVGGQYVESVGNLGRRAQLSYGYYQRRYPTQTVELKAMPCRLADCPWGRS